MTNNICKTCKHWKSTPFRHGDPRHMCSKISTSQEVVPETEAAISMFSEAAFLTPPTFGCLFWEQKS